MKKVYEIILLVGVAFLLIYLGAVIGASVVQKCPTIETKVKVDTLVVLDTIRVSEPVYVTQKVVDRIVVPVTDTIVKNDTTFVYLPRTQRKYMSPYYDAWVSGYNPTLDSIKIFQKTKYVTKEIPYIVKQKRHWGIGVQVGYGAGKEGLSPYVGVGLHYNLLSW